MDNEFDPYPCIGICTPDPDSGYCLGCGRPPLASPVVVAELVTRPRDLPPRGDDDNPPPA